MPEYDSTQPPLPWQGLNINFLDNVIDDIHWAADQGSSPDEARRRSAGEALLPMWPYLIGIMERNCLPGNELHPEVRTVYERFAAASAEFIPQADADYAAWLAGDKEVDDKARQSYMRRWDAGRAAGAD